MAEQPPPKEGESFFRKMVRFVANPATDWADLNAKSDDGREFDLEKSELKAMIERKRRNDFVRKREFDMLRKLRREGLSPEQLAALGGSSRIDDSEVRMMDTGMAKADGAVKAKIDEIEQQMVGDGYATTRRAGDTQNGALPSRLRAGGANTSHSREYHVQTEPGKLPALPPLSDFDVPAAGSAPVVMAGGMSPLATAAGSRSDGVWTGGDGGDGSAVEVNEVVHDPDLDEAVIAFANADFAQCEQALSQLTSSGGNRNQHPETWLVLFDLYRATGQQNKFEALAMEYANAFGWSAPQWFSLPKQVAEAAAAAAEERPLAARASGDIGWVCPEVLDTDAVARLRSATLQLPLPWVFDWSSLRRVDAEAASQLSMLFRQWAGQALEMRWLSGDQLFAALADAAPTGVRDVDPALWLVRLDALRLVNRADQFDEAAIDYCVTFEVSPPSWERARCVVRVGGASVSTRSPPMSIISEVATSFMETDSSEDHHSVQVASVELSGQLVGDIGATLKNLDVQLGHASVVSVSCARLIRVDFVAAGDLLNWVLSKRSENRSVTFVDANRLIALFFGAMGINEHSKVQVRNV
jgi:hypothetical protein